VAVGGHPEPGRGGIFDTILGLVRRGLGFTDPDPARDADKTNHTGMVRYGNEARQLWAAFPGMSRAEAIAKEILWVVPDRDSGG